MEPEMLIKHYTKTKDSKGWEPLLKVTEYSQESLLCFACLIGCRQGHESDEVGDDISVGVEEIDGRPSRVRKQGSKTAKTGLH